MLVGNKKDVCDKNPKKRKITPEMGQALAQVRRTFSFLSTDFFGKKS
jgi:hypothetical protein